MSLLSPAFAQAAPETTATTTTGAAPGTAYQEPSALASLLPLVLIFVVFYFLILRPQQKKMREHLDMVSSLKRGDRVLTGGGIIGTVSKIEADNDVVVIEIAPDVLVRVSRPTITNVLQRTGTPDANDNQRTGATAKKAVKGTAASVKKAR